MRKAVFLLTLLLIWPVMLSGPARAHVGGQPPFFKVNGVYSGLYPVQSTSLDNLPLPQDMAPANYLVGEKIDFEIDVSQLPIPPEIIAKTKFVWDFGDNSKKEIGLKNSHIYSRMGSFVLSIEADTSNYDASLPSQSIQTTMLNILPNANYHLPRSVILINDQIVTDPLNQPIYVDFKKKIRFTASRSISDVSIASYLWDLGDGKSFTTQSIDYLYPKNEYPQGPGFVNVVLRIKNSDGFISDSFAQVEDQILSDKLGLITPTPNPLTKSTFIGTSLNNKLKIATAITVSLVGWFILKRQAIKS